MPTQRFLNLKEEKKEAIKQAAMQECARVPYEEISINKIIKTADISRGSFYTYFADKDDMIKYLLDDFRDASLRRICERIEKEGGDTITAVENLIVEVMEYGTRYSNSGVYKNLLLNVGTLTNIKTLSPNKRLYDNPEYLDFIDRCYQLNDKEKCPFKSPEQMTYVMEMLFLLSIKHLTEYHMMESSDENKIRAILHEQMEIIRRGL